MWRSTETVKPERQLPLRRFFSLILFPPDIISVLKSDGGKLGPLFGGQRGVKRSQFFCEDAQRPAIGNDVMEDDQEQVPLIRDMEEGSSKERFASQIERLSRLSTSQSLRLLVGLFFGKRREIDKHARPGCSVQHPGERNSVSLIKRGPERLLPLHQRVQRLLQRIAIELPGEPQRDNDVVDRITRIFLREEPESSLGARKRQ